MSRMPVDVKKLLEAFSQAGEERGLPVNVDLVIDPTAPEALIDCMLTTFVDARSDAHVEAVVLEGAVPELALPCDLAVIVGGASPLLGDVASAGRARGIPSVVAVQRGHTFFTRAADGVAQAAGAGDVRAAAPTGGGAHKGVPLADVIDVELSAGQQRPLEELGAWVVANAPAKRLSFAECFAFIRHPLALELARENAVQNGAIGLVFFIPGADMPVITANQAKMVLQIGALYGYAPGKERAREVAAVVASGFGLRGIARRLASALPGLSWAIKPTVAATGTMALAQTAIAYFEDPANLHAADVAAERLAELATRIAEQGRAAVAGVQGAARASRMQRDARQQAAGGAAPPAEVAEEVSEG